MHTDADYIAYVNCVEIERLQRFIDQDGIAHRSRSRRSQNKQPTWCDDSRSEGIIAGVNQVYSHGPSASFLSAGTAERPTVGSWVRGYPIWMDCSEANTCLSWRPGSTFEFAGQNVLQIKHMMLSLGGSTSGAEDPSLANQLFPRERL